MRLITRQTVIKLRKTKLISLNTVRNKIISTLWEESRDEDISVPFFTRADLYRDIERRTPIN